MVFTDLDNLLNNEIMTNKLRGCSMYVEQGDKILFNKTYGSDNPNSIYKIYSMTKPITSVATMILLERGLISVDEPVSKYLPAYKNMKVATETGIKPAKNQITIKHLLDMTSGLCYPGGETVSEKTMAAL